MTFQYPPPLRFVLTRCVLFSYLDAEKHFLSIVKHNMVLKEYILEKNENNYNSKILENLEVKTAEPIGPQDQQVRIKIFLPKQIR